MSRDSFTPSQEPALPREKTYPRPFPYLHIDIRLNPRGALHSASSRADRAVAAHGRNTHTRAAAQAARSRRAARRIVLADPRIRSLRRVVCAGTSLPAPAIALVGGPLLASAPLVAGHRTVLGRRRDIRRNLM
jgi:hypothetical protein